MEQLSASERGWIWTARLLGSASFMYVLVALQGSFPTPGYVLIGGLLGGEFVYKASRKGGE